MFHSSLLLAALVAAVFLVSLRAQAAEEPWKPAAGPLLTRWAKDVSPDNALPEYPRPQMVRKDWLNLNGLWEYAVTPKEAAAAPAQWDGKILVPYPIESALSGVMKQVSETERLWYRRTFDVPKDWAGKRVLLHFGAVDWDATVSVNGKEVGAHRGGYDAFSFDITDVLKAGGPQEILVSVYDPTNSGDQPRGKQVHKPGGIMYTPTTGLWQTVWLEPVPYMGIENLRITPDVDASSVALLVRVPCVLLGKSELEVVASAGGKTVARLSRDISIVTSTQSMFGVPVELTIPDPRLWSPEDPFLYDLKVTLKREGKVSDAVESYFGMRKIALGKDSKGVNRLMLNGQFIFQIGFLDQGFWPDGIYTAPTDAALRYDIEMTRKLGMNLARKHVKVEPDRWYYWADKLGLLVWQDMPSGNNGVRQKKDAAGKPIPLTPEEEQRAAQPKKQFETELRRLIEGRRNHPSIIMWVVFNEGWGQHDTERHVEWVKRMDPSRLVNNASGWSDKGVGDVNDVHSYPNPKCPPLEEKRACVLGEFGGLGLAIEGHTWKKEHWGYRGMADQDELTRTYEKLLQKAHELKESAGLCAAVYTQTTDCEVECNGLLTYDRAVVKPDLERVAAANLGDFSKVPPPPVSKTVVPTSEEQGVEWRYTVDRPADNWMKTDFDDTKWKAGPGGFGTAGTPGAVARTPWKTADIWLRREFTLPDAKYASLHFRVHHDEDVEIYINGVLAGKFKNYLSEYEEQPMTPQGRAALKPGKNILAVHCTQTKGGQYIDVGLVDVVPARK